MGCNFNSVDDLLSARDALRNLSDKLSDARYRIEALSSFDDIPSTFNQILTEALDFRKSKDYEILKDYQSNFDCPNFFDQLNFELLHACKQKKYTFSTVNRILTKLELTERIVDDVLEEMQSKYFL